MPHKKRTATGVLGGIAGLVGLSAVAGVLVTATVTPAIAVSGYAATSAISAFDNMPSFLQIEKLMLPTEIYAKNADGSDRLLTEFFDQNRIPVTYDEIAPVMFDAILSSEDKNFYSHGGVDLVGTVSALVGNATSGSNRGGSSITQQYVKNVLQQNCEVEAAGDADKVAECYRSTTVSEGVDGYQRKLQEMRYAIQLEQDYSKDDILVGYLNIANFGGTVYGIGAAAEYYFGIPASQLTIGQSAAIAGMVQEPNTFRLDRPADQSNSVTDGFAATKDRQTYVLDRMLADGKITQAEHDEAVAAPIEPQITPRPSGCTQATGAEFFCEYVVSTIENDTAFGETEADRLAQLRRGGLKIYTTLDPDLQNAALEAMTVVPGTVPYMDLGASGVQVEVGTGRVLSMVQNRPYSATGEDPATTPVNYNVRQIDGGGIGHPAGSTYKMFSVVNWLEQGHSINEQINGRVGNKKVETCDGATTTAKASNDNRQGSIGNFESNSGYVGSPLRFTADSLNSGFLAMAEQISVCSTNRTAMKMGVMRGDGTPLDNLNVPYDVLGSSNVAPIDMASAYAAVAANGMLCQPKAIDRVVDRDGQEAPIPERTCERVISEAVASTTAYALEGVMNGTGSGARTFDGTPIFGKTGIHQYEHTWMDGSSTKVATVVWVGNVIGNAKLNEYRVNGYQLSRIRNSVWPDMQRAANAKYGGDAFPTPDQNLTRVIYRDLPSVIGMSVDQARQTLEAAGFQVNVGEAVDGTHAAGTITRQDPGAGRVAGGLTVTINPSNGEGVSVPAVNGTPQDAQRQLRSAGFGSTTLQCTASESAPDQGVVTGTDPAAGAVVNRNTQVTVQYQAKNCNGGGGNNNGGGNGGNNP